MRGAARLALETGSPIVPVALVGTEQAVRPHRLKLGLPRIRVLVARPFDVARARPTIAAAREVTRRVEEAIAELRRPYGEPRHAWIEDA
jgi:1-acyl-sn-glycerol-3-phosphate acyltransferase